MQTTTAVPIEGVKRFERILRVRQLASSGEARRLRQRTKTPMSQIAEACGVDVTTVWRWEAGQRCPRGETALRYGVVLEMMAKVA